MVFCLLDTLTPQTALSHAIGRALAAGNLVSAMSSAMPSGRGNYKSRHSLEPHLSDGLRLEWRRRRQPENSARVLVGTSNAFLAAPIEPLKV